VAEKTVCSYEGEKSVKCRKYKLHVMRVHTRKSAQHPTVSATLSVIKHFHDKALWMSLNSLYVLGGTVVRYKRNMAPQTMMQQKTCNASLSQGNLVLTFQTSVKTPYTTGRPLQEIYLQRTVQHRKSGLTTLPREGFELTIKTVDALHSTATVIFCNNNSRNVQP
jgi:hypothetical protein